MKLFKLPDLGEGLTEAEIVEWHVDVGARVEAHAPLVSVETAKAVVEIPAPRQGRIARRFGEVGDIVQTGAPLVEFGDGAPAATVESSDPGTVVGEVKAGGFVEDRYIQTISKSGHIGRWVYGVRGAPDVAQAKAGLARLNKALDGLEVPQGAAPPAGEPDSEYTTPPSESDLGEPTYDSVETGEE